MATYEITLKFKFEPDDDFVNEVLELDAGAEPTAGEIKDALEEYLDGNADGGTVGQIFDEASHKSSTVEFVKE